MVKIFTERKYPRILVGDWETTGVIDNVPNPPYFSGPQGIDCGFCVVDNVYGKWKVIDEFQAKVRWLGPDDTDPNHEVEHPGLTWDSFAETIHGYSKEFCKNSSHPKHVAPAFKSFLLKNFQDDKVVFGGYNPAFDMYFNKQLFMLAGMGNDPEVRWHYAMLDLHTLGFFLYGLTNSSSVFKKVLDRTRGTHSAIEDARYTVDAFSVAVENLEGIPYPEDEFVD